MRKRRPAVDLSPSGGVKQITECIWWVGRGPWGGLAPLSNPGDCNIYLVRGRNFDVLIDAGGSADVTRLERNLRRCGSDPGRVGEIWLTHSHRDHSAGAWAWAWRHPRAVCRLSDLGVRFLRRGDLRLTGSAGITRSAWQPPPRLRGLKGGAVLRCPPHVFEAVPLPGHAPDCIGYRGRVDGLDVMFTGDAIIGDQGRALGVVGWLDWLWLSDARQYERTLRRAAARPPQLLLPGHGVGHVGPAARRSIGHCLRRVRLLLAIPQPGTMFPFIGR